MACVPARCINNRSLTSARRCCAFDNLRVVWSNRTSIVATSICKCNNRFNVPDSKFGAEVAAHVRNSSSIFSCSSADWCLTVFNSFFIASICFSRPRCSYYLAPNKENLGGMDTYIVQLDHFVGEKHGISHGFGLSVYTEGDFNRCGQLFRGIGRTYTCWQSI